MASSQEPKFLSHHGHPLPQRLGWHLALRGTTIREAHNSLGSALRNSRGPLCGGFHDTKSMAEWPMVAYNEKGCLGILSTM